MTFSVSEQGVEATLGLLRRTGRRVPQTASRALNKIALRGRTRIARRIGEQISVPASYLAPSGGRLIVSRKASPSSLVAVITARSRPTSLARFARGRGRGNVRVEVRPGRVRELRRAFFIRLRQGSALTDTQFNLGLAIRLRPGERIENKVRQAQLAKGLYLLYGPSVQQVFLDNASDGVAAREAPAIAGDLETEFLRLLKL